MAEKAETSGRPTAPAPGGLTLIVLKDDKIAEILAASREMLETQFRHSLELANAGLVPAVSKEGDGCCNCVAC